MSMDLAKSDKPLGSNTSRILQGLDQSMQAFQWVRELFTNAKDAGATIVLFGLTMVVGVRKRYVIDNGKGMLSHAALELTGEDGIPIDVSGFRDMAELMNLGEGDEEEEHFGIGAKASLLGWNSHGLLYLSRAKAASGHLVESVAWLRISEGVPKLRAMPVTDDAGVQGVETCPVLGLRNSAGWYRDEYTSAWLVNELDGMKPWELFDRELARQRIVAEDGTGTIVIMLGMKPEDETDGGNPNFPSEASNQRGISRYLNGRYPRLDGMTVGQDYVFAQKDGTVKFRSAVGLVAQLEANSQGGKLTTPAPVTLSDGTEVQFYIDAEAIRREIEGKNLDSKEGNVQPAGRVFVTFRGEVYENLADRLSRWGVGKPKVANHTWVVLTPPDALKNPTYGVKPDQARRGLVLVGHGDGSLPEVDWQDEIRPRLPSELRELMDQVSLGGPDEAAHDQIRRTISELVQSLAEQDIAQDVLVMNPSGKVEASLTTKGGDSEPPNTPPPPNPDPPSPSPLDPSPDGPDGKGQPAQPDPGAATFARRRRHKGGPPRIVLVDKLEDDSSDAIVELAYNGEELIMNVDTTHEYVQREVAHWANKEEYDHLDKDDLVAPLVQYSIGGMAVFAYLRLLNDVSVDQHDKRVGSSDLLTPPVLSVAARVPVHHIVKPRLDGRK